MRLPITLTLALVALASLKAEAPPLDGMMPEDLIPQLKPLLKEGVERSPSMITASIGVASAESTRYSYAAGLWPQVSLSGSYQDSDERISENSTPSRASGFNYSANISQPIFQWGALKNQAIIGNLGLKIAQRQYAEAYRLLAVSIREKYVELIGKKILLRNAEFNVKLSNEALKAMQARYDSGAVSQAELGNVRMTVEDAQLQADRAQEDLNYARKIFSRLVGIDDLAEDSIPIDLPHFELPASTADAVLAGFVGEGISSTFQSQVYNMYLKQDDATYKIAKVRLLPKISANANIGYSLQTSISGTSIDQEHVESETYSVAASWTIFDGFATRGAKLSALAQKRAAERTLQTYVDSTVDQVTNMRHTLGFSARSMSIAEVHYNLIEAEVKRINQDLALGYASQAAIDAGTLDLYGNDYLRSYARSDLYDRWVEFISLAGIDPALSNISPRYVR